MHNEWIWSDMARAYKEAEWVVRSFIVTLVNSCQPSHLRLFFAVCCISFFSLSFFYFLFLFTKTTPAIVISWQLAATSLALTKTLLISHRVCASCMQKRGVWPFFFLFQFFFYSVIYLFSLFIQSILFFGYRGETHDTCAYDVLVQLHCIQRFKDQGCMASSWDQLVLPTTTDVGWTMWIPFPYTYEITTMLTDVMYLVGYQIYFRIIIFILNYHVGLRRGTEKAKLPRLRTEPHP